MAGCKSDALLFVLNVILFTCVLSSCVRCPPKTPPSVPSPPKTTPSPPKTPPSAPSPPKAKCPKDTLKFGVCGDWLSLVHEVIGTPPSSECCAIVEGLADLEAALCLCTAIKANVLGVIKVKEPIAISLIVDSCGKKVPKGFKCA